MDCRCWTVGEADDKIIAIMQSDNIWSTVEDIDELAPTIVQRLRHYFTTYKVMPGDAGNQVSIDHVYGSQHAEQVIQSAIEDYQDEFGGE